MIQFPCPACGREVRAPDGSAGRRGRCPYCRGSVAIPALKPVRAEDEDEPLKALAAAAAPPPPPAPQAGRPPPPLPPSAAEPATERQLAYAADLGLPLPPGATKAQGIELIASFEHIRHYIFGLWLAMTGQSAAELGLSDQVEALAVEIVNGNPQLRGQLADVVEEFERSRDFLRADPGLRRTMEKILRKRFRRYL